MYNPPERVTHSYAEEELFQLQALGYGGHSEKLPAVYDEVTEKLPVVKALQAKEMKRPQESLIAPNASYPQMVEKSVSHQFKPIGLRQFASWEPGEIGYGPGLRARESEAVNPDELPIDERDTLIIGIAQQQGKTTTTMQSEISGAASSAAFVGIGTIVNYVLKYGNYFLLQRGLGAASFGLYSIGMSLVTLMVSILTLGMDDAMVRYVSIYKSKKQTKLLRGLMVFCFIVAGGFGILGAIFMISFAPFLAAFRKTPELVSVLQVMAPLVPLLCLQAISFGGLVGFRQFKAPVLWQRIFVPTLSFLLLAGTLYFFRNAVAAAAVTVVGTIIGVGFSLSFLSRAAKRNLKPESNAYAVRKWVGFAIPNFLTTIIDTVLDSIDTLLLTFFAVTNAAIGQYNAAIKISGFIGMPLAVLNTIFAPIIAELHNNGEREKLEAMFKVVTKWAITFSLPIFAIATLFSVPLLSLSGDTFIGAWPLLIVFAVGGLVNVATGPVGLMLLMTGHQRFSFLNSLAAVTANIVLGIILTPRYGAMGTAISTALATCVVNLLRVLQVFLILKMQPYRWDTLKPVGTGLISAAVTGGLLYLLRQTHWFIPLFHAHWSIEFALIPVFLAIYIGLLALFKTAPEDKIVLDALRKKLKRGKN
jgi:O-antigen/teichoic acid export membrane protein